MRKKIVSLLMAAVMSISMTACGGSDDSADTTAVTTEGTTKATEDKSESTTENISKDKSSEDTEKTWAIYMYMCGTDLESNYGCATNDISEILDADIPDNVTVIIQTGGTSEWQNDVIDPNYIQRYIVEDGDITLVDEQELTSMGDKDTLKDYLNFCVENYSADYMMPVFWNHGGGSLSGVEFDEVFDNDSLSLTELDEAFYDVISANNCKFEIVGFDTCLMGTLENANIMSQYANYMVASEETEPGNGWYYTQWISYLSKNPSANGAELGKEICDAYYKGCEEVETQDNTTLSCIDLSKIPALVDAFNLVAGDITTISLTDSSSYASFARGAVRAENYGGNTDETGYFNMVDIGDLIKNTNDVLSDASQNVLSALDDAVVYKVNGSGRQNANGLSVFFPLGTYGDEMDTYADISVSDSYSAYLTYAITGEVPEDVSDYVDADIEYYDTGLLTFEDDSQLVTFENEDGYFELNIDTSYMDAIRDVYFNLGYYDEEYDELIMLGRDNDIYCDWENGIFEDNFRGVWPLLNGEWVYLDIITATEDYSLYNIPVILNGERKNIRVAYVWDDEENGHYEVYGVCGSASENGMASKEMTKLKDGDEITPLLYSLSGDDDDFVEYEGTTFTVDGEAIVEEYEIPNGSYIFMYEVEDMQGNTTYSDAAEIVYEDGDITVYAD